jgi:hypothetical protein
MQCERNMSIRFCPIKRVVTYVLSPWQSFSRAKVFRASNPRRRIFIERRADIVNTDGTADGVILA